MGGQEEGVDQQEVWAMNDKDVQRRRRAVKFLRIPKPLSPSDHNGTFVGSPPQRVDPASGACSARAMQYLSALERAEREER